MGEEFSLVANNSIVRKRQKKTQIMSMETTQQKIEGQKLLMGGEQGGGVKAILCQVVTVVLPVNILQRVFSGLVTLTHVI